MNLSLCIGRYGVISCGGNALINIGPTHDGRIVPIFEERLTQLGTLVYACRPNFCYYNRNVVENKR